VLLLARDSFEKYASAEAGGSTAEGSGEALLGPLELHRLLGDMGSMVRAETGLRWVSHPHWTSSQDLLHEFDLQQAGGLDFPAFMALLARPPFDRLLPPSARRQVPVLLEAYEAVWKERREAALSCSPGSETATPGSETAPPGSRVGWEFPNSPQHLFSPKSSRKETVAKYGEQIYEYHLP